MYYFLYARTTKDEIFRPVNWKVGKRVINLIYATMFNLHDANIVLEEAQRMNPDMEFKLKRITG